jgi:hypothetical protein
MTLKSQELAAHKRAQQKTLQKKELEELALEDIFAFQNQVKENWQHHHIQQHKNHQPKTEEVALNKDATTCTQIQNTPHLIIAQKSFDEMQDQEIRQKLQKQLTRDYELGEHLFEIDIKDLGKIAVAANIKDDAWHFALNAEKSSTQNWLFTQQNDLTAGLNRLTQQNLDLDSTAQKTAPQISLNII